MTIILVKAWVQCIEQEGRYPRHHLHSTLPELICHSCHVRNILQQTNRTSDTSVVLSENRRDNKRFHSTVFWLAPRVVGNFNSFTHADRHATIQRDEHIQAVLMQPSLILMAEWRMVPKRWIPFVDYMGPIFPIIAFSY